MDKRYSRMIGIIMLVVAIVFVVFALNHPEGSFPWPNTVTYPLYGLYLILTLIMLIAPFKNKNR